MNVIFISNNVAPLPRWSEAFPGLIMALPRSPDFEGGNPSNTLHFFDLNGFDVNSAAATIKKWVSGQYVVIALSGNPTEQEAFTLIATGARGYCHVASKPEQLQEVARVVAAGQLWLPRAMVQNFVNLSKVGVSTAQSKLPDGYKTLTRRELQVALAVADGASNKEIAARLSITERTVKSRLTACFQKLGCRDRVQLALSINQIPDHLR